MVDNSFQSDIIIYIYKHQILGFFSFLNGKEKPTVHKFW